MSGTNLAIGEHCFVVVIHIIKSVAVSSFVGVVMVSFTLTDVFTVLEKEFD